MNSPTKSILSVGLIGGGAGIPYLTYYQMVIKPTKEENKKFEEVFKEQEKLIRSLNIENLEENEDAISAAPKISKWCDEKIKDPTQEVRKSMIFADICSNKFSSIKEYILLLDDKQLITNDEDYETSSFFFKDSDIINPSEQEIGGKQLRSWCEEQLNKKISKSDINILDKINEFCKIPIINTVEKIIKEVYRDWIMTSNWKEAFEKWKNTPEFISILKEYDSSITADTQQEQGGTKMKEFCESLKNKKLSSKTSDGFLYQVTFSCWGKTPEDMQKSRSTKSENERSH